ncbi:MAG: gliding motility-associated protein GldE [Bacteroidaceae bacterium]|nr:gliding motility-associated protein GldE [Bacteroidaceae bacterium]
MDPDSYLNRFFDLFFTLKIEAPSVGALLSLAFALLLLLAYGFFSTAKVAYFSITARELNDLSQNESLPEGKLRKLMNSSERLLATFVLSNHCINLTFILLINYFFADWMTYSVPILQFAISSIFAIMVLLLSGNLLSSIFRTSQPLSFCLKTVGFFSKLLPLLSPFTSLLIKRSFFINLYSNRHTHNLSVEELTKNYENNATNELREENDIIESIIRFGKETTNDIMISRMDMIDFEIETPLDEVYASILEHSFSRIPVYEGSKDNIKGILYVKDLLPNLISGKEFRWQSLIRKAYFVPETKMIDDLLREFQNNKVHIAIVVDEFGGTSGLVTLEDVIEEIVGDINDEYDNEELFFTKENETTFIFEAKISLVDFYKAIQVDESVFEEIGEDADTLAGLLLAIKGQFPSEGEKLSYKNYIFQVIEMDERRILKVRCTLLPDY